MQSKILALLISLLFFLTLNVTNPVTAVTTHYVLVNPDDCGTPAPGPTYTSVSAAIGAAVDGDIIKLCNNIVETVPLVNINKSLTIVGTFLGNSYSWVIQDSDSTTPALNVSKNVTFENISIYINSTAGDPESFIEVYGSQVIFKNTTVTGYSSITTPLATYSLVKAIESWINITDSTFIFTNTTDTPRTSIVFNLISSDLYIDPSIITNEVPANLTYRGAIIKAFYNGTIRLNNKIMILSSNISALSNYMDGFVFTISDNAKLDVNIESSKIETKSFNYIFRFSVDKSNITANIKNSLLRGYEALQAEIRNSTFMLRINPSHLDIFLDGFVFNDLIGSTVNIEIVGSDVDVSDFFYFQNDIIDTSFNMYIESSDIYASDEGLDFFGDLVGNSAFYFEMYSSDFISDDETFEISDVMDDSLFDIFIEDSYVESETDEVFGDFKTDLYNNSVFDLTVVDSWVYADEEAVLIDMYDNSILNINFTSSHIDTYEDAIDLDLYGNSYSNINIVGTLIHEGASSWDYGLEVVADDDSNVDIHVDHSDIGKIYLDNLGFGSITAELIETRYDEINSYTFDANVYSQWTILFTILSIHTGNPVIGAGINIFNGTDLLGTVYTGPMGTATFTFSYNYTSSTPFIPQLVFSAWYKASQNITFYIDFSENETLPYWYGNITILLEVLILSAHVAGSLGTGNLYLTPSSGILTIGSPLAGGWVNTYQITVSGIMYVPGYMVINIKVLYHGNWVDGYIMVNLESRYLYIKFGGIELYGSF